MVGRGTLMGGGGMVNVIHTHPTRYNKIKKIGAHCHSQDDKILGAFLSYRNLSDFFIHSDSYFIKQPLFFYRSIVLSLWPEIPYFTGFRWVFVTGWGRHFFYKWPIINAITSVVVD